MLVRRLRGWGLGLGLALWGCGAVQPFEDCVPMACSERACGATDGCGAVCESSCVEERLPGAIIPFYAMPGHEGFHRLAETKRRNPALPMIVVVNPATGPGPAPLEQLAYDVDLLADEGITVLGYVPTSYGARPLSDVKADIDRYRSFYPRLQGVFFDEMSNFEGDESYYLDATAHARAAGMSRTVGNPGVQTLPSYHGTVDVLVIYGANGLPPSGALDGWHTAHDRAGFGVIPHSVEELPAQFVAEARERVGWVFVTDDVQPNPWDGLPSYFDPLIEALR